MENDRLEDDLDALLARLGLIFDLRG